MNQKPIYIWFVLALLSSLLGLFSSQLLPPMIQLEQKIFDTRALFRLSPSSSSKIILLQLNPLTDYPDFYNFLQKTDAQHIRSLGLDTPNLFSSRYTDDFLRLLATKSFPVVLSSRFSPQTPPYQHLVRHASFSQFLEGHDNYIADSDGILRQWQPVLKYKTQRAPEMSKAFVEQMYLSLNEPPHPAGQRYFSFPSHGQTIYRLKDLSPDLLSQHIILVSDSSDPSYVSTRYQDLSALEVHGIALKNLLEAQYLRSPLWLNFSFTLVFCGCLVGLFHLSHFLGRWVTYIGGLALVLSVITFNFLIFQQSGFWLHLSQSLVSGLFLWGCSLFFFPATSHKPLPMAPFKANTDIPVQNERKQVTVMFTDIQGFTKMGENLPPDHVMGLLNEYLSEMTDIIFENHGSLDKYIGDGIMAVYGKIGKNQPHQDAYNAVKTALEMQAKMEDLQRSWMTKKRKPFRIRIGIHSGEAVVGYVGHLAHKEITVIGDTVNTAAHLEKLSKSFQSQLLISQNTYNYVKDLVEVTERGSHELKGKTKHVKVYEVKGWKA